MPAAALRARSGADRSLSATPAPVAPMPPLRLADPPPPQLTTAPSHTHSPAPTPDSQLPTPHPDTAVVLLDYLNPELTIVKVAVKHKLSFEQLTELIESPKARRMLARLQEAEQRRAEIIIAHSQPAAVQALVRALSAKSPETARKAASALLRMHAQVQKSQLCSATASGGQTAVPASRAPDALQENGRAHPRHEQTTAQTSTQSTTPTPRASDPHPGSSVPNPKSQIPHPDPTVTSPPAPPDQAVASPRSAPERS